MYCVIKRRMFDNDFFPLAYSSTTSFSTPQIPPHKLALFFMILCLGALFDLNSAPYNQLSKRYYALAKASLAVDSTGSVVSVQTVMLMGTYLLNEHSHATSGGEEFWPLLGLAMKHAVAVRFSSPPSSPLTSSSLPSTREGKVVLTLSRTPRFVFSCSSVSTGTARTGICQRRRWTSAAASSLS